jgi:hypothetical protein
MCEITNGKIYVADRDLVCYKVMLEKGEDLKSLHQVYEYKIGWEYRVEGFEYRCCMTNNIIYEVWNRNFSPFAGWRKIYTTFPNLYYNGIWTDLCYTRCGFYSYTYYGSERMEFDSEVVSEVYGSDRIRFVRCRIPEGSKYMVSDNGEVFISERIVIDDAWSL